MIEQWVRCRASGTAASLRGTSFAAWTRRVPCWSIWVRCSHGSRTASGALSPARVADAQGGRGAVDLLGTLRAGCMVGVCVTYSITFGASERPVTHWVPAWMLTVKS